jgi:hypothetical protein
MADFVAEFFGRFAVQAMSGE